MDSTLPPPPVKVKTPQEVGKTRYEYGTKPWTQQSRSMVVPLIVLSGATSVHLESGIVSLLLV